MNHKKWAFFVFFIVILIGFLAPSCAKKEIKSTPVMSEDEARRRAEEEARKRELERQASIREESLRDDQLREEARTRFKNARDMFENEDILFEFDSASLSAEAQEILRTKAAWLRENPRAKVTIEGHCDERGTSDYNLALGDRRAFSAKSFLTDLGIQESRLMTISYGEERPIDSTASEEAWAKNRRAHFVIKE